jgi:hypothetical protein
MIFLCCQENRRAAILGNPTINGIDYLEVLDHAAVVANLRQRVLFVRCLKAAPTDLTPDNVLITGGESITGVSCQWIGPASGTLPSALSGESSWIAANVLEPANVLVVLLNEYGDFSPYVFRLVQDAVTAAEALFDTPETLEGFDPQLSEVTFSFKVECGPEFDCAPVPPDCPPEGPPPPPIDYTAKDFGAFRQVMLDRIAQLVPGWGPPTTEADIGVMMTELVAYVADQLSYRQDAVATEAYLNTARSRISLRRHALLVDYRISEGCNARAWVQVWVNADVFLDRTVTRFYTTAPNMPASLDIAAKAEEAALIAGVVAFEPMQDANLRPEHNQISFYTWGDTNCCLPQGATSATLKKSFPNLHIGDVLIFKEALGPQTGLPADADIRHRCAVRLTAIATQDASGQPLVDPLFDVNGKAITSSAQTPQQVTEIQWSAEDALPFPVCVSSRFTDSTGAVQEVSDVSVVLGNIVLADQGLTMQPTSLGSVPAPSLFYAPNLAADRCELETPQALPVRFRPSLPDSPLTQAVPLSLTGAPASTKQVNLSAVAPVSLTDSKGQISLTAAADEPLQWPQYLGVIATSDGTGFDLEVVYAPPAGPVGVAPPVVLEKFTGLNLTSGDPNFAATRLLASKLVRVVSAPTATVPTSFPTAPTMLPNTGNVDLEDSSSTTYLTLTTTSPLGWPPLFAVAAQGELSTPDAFNLLLLYAPKSGLQGVTGPVLIDQYANLTLANAASTVDGGPNLITVATYEEEPSPSLSATALMTFSPNAAVPQILKLEGQLVGSPTSDWTVEPDLLSASPEDKQFVVETDTDGTAYLRFGDGANGEVPVTGTAFTATYRIGNGTAGNVGAETLTNIAAGGLSGLSCSNPMPAMGGTDPETNAQIRRRAPQAFMTQERAVTLEDYVDVVERDPQIEDAAAVARWTGSWYTVFITAEPQGGCPMTPPLQRKLTRLANRYRLAGQDILIKPPQYISLDIRLAVCVELDAFRLDVEAALLQVLGSGILPNGQPALFSPQNFELGQPVYLSVIYTAARSVAGVRTVMATVFQPQAGPDTQVYLQQGFIPMGPFQVARMDNDPSLPANGRLTLSMEGGK